MMMVMVVVVQLMRIEYACSAFFLADIVVCLVTSPSRLRYATSLITIVNFVSLIPTAVRAVVEQLDPERCLYHFRVRTRTHSAIHHLLHAAFRRAVKMHFLNNYFYLVYHSYIDGPLYCTVALFLCMTGHPHTPV